MSHLEPYTLTTLLSSTVTLVMGILLFAVSVPRDPGLKNYRISRWFLTGAYIILSGFGWLEIFGENDMGEPTIVMVFTLIAASYQAMLFTFSTLTLINVGYMTRRVVLRNIIPVTILAVVLLTFLFSMPQQPFYVAFYVMAGLYCLQIVYYIVLFRGEYRKYRWRFDNFFSGDEYRRLIWIRNAFYMAACVGVIAVVSLFVNILLYTIFTGAYTLFYIYFAVKFINYVTIFHRIAPVVDTSKETTSRNYSDNQIIPAAIECWINTKGFVQQDITLESLAIELCTNQSYLSRYINAQFGQNFKAWINSLRIGEAQRLLDDQHDLSLTEVAEQSGIPSNSTFYRNFVTVTGMTPAEYRRQKQSESKMINEPEN